MGIISPTGVASVGIYTPPVLTVFPLQDDPCGVTDQISDFLQVAKFATGRFVPVAVFLAISQGQRPYGPIGQLGPCLVGIDGQTAIKALQL